MAVNKYSYQVPYGVVRVSDDRISELLEKPVYDLFVNAGIYVLSPEALAMIPRGVHFDLPSLFDKLAGEGRTTLAFPIREYWLDIGQPNDLARAEKEFSTLFAPPRRQR
jgi:NDP-sugar pyrophosphorylase family protein